MAGRAVEKMSFEDIFDDKVQYEMPFFQRGYSWEKENWVQLLDDIQENILDEFGGEKKFSETEFFFGSIVIAESKQQTLPNMPRRFLVIDGQQRLTTVYIALSIIYNLLRKKADESPELALTGEIGSIARHIINDVKTKDDYDRIKLLSCKGDKMPTYQTVFDTDIKPRSPTLNDDYYSYNENSNKLKSLAAYLRIFFGKKEVEVLLDWKNILLKSLKVVWIPIDENKDDIQSIFETLNDRGRPLTASELICNYIFKPFAGEDSQKFNALHTEKWLTTIGKIDKSGNIEDYLITLFSLGEPVAIGCGKNVYIHVKKKYKNITTESASCILAEIEQNVEFYNEVINPKSISPHHKYRKMKIFSLLSDIADTRMESSRYFAIQILQAFDKNEISQENAEKLLAELLTTLVRRKVSASATNMYNRVFPSLFGKIRNRENLVDAFIDEMIDAGIYVTDELFKESFVKNKLYSTSAELSFTRMILKNIDKSQEPYSQHADYQNFDTVEHIMPQKLSSEWKRYIGNDANNQILKIHINSIGNLCLLNKKANSHASQDVFEEKIKEYPDASSLTRDLKNHKGMWNIQAIIARSERLAKIANNLWKWSYNKDKNFEVVSAHHKIGSNEMFYLRDERNEADASGNLLDDGSRFVVYRNSVCNKKLTSNQDEIEKWRGDLKYKGIIAQTQSDGIVFLQDHIFNSPSTAASVIRGGAANGWEYWKNQEDKTLDECHRKG
jgi:uncharacterized protein with ParB-like and HNH nuclease domain